MTGTLFEDVHTDVRMRRTIPQFAYLGAASVAVTAPFVAPDRTALAVLLGLVAAAVATGLGVSWRGLIDRLPHGAIVTLLAAYCLMISLAIATTGDASSPYRLLFVLPVTFTAVFFTGWVRYSTALVAPLGEVLIAGSWIPLSTAQAVTRTLMFLVLAHFGAVVSDTLRGTLRTQASLHEVLQASTGAPLDGELAAIGLRAAIAVTGWSGGAVLVPDGSRLVPAAAVGFSPGADVAYLRSQARFASVSVANEAFATGELVYLADVRERYPAEHFLVEEGVVSLAAVPLVYREERIGMLVLVERRHRALAPPEQDRLKRVADQLSLALGSAAAYRRETEVAEQLRELNRRKDEFLANVSHELRTPAATIKLVASTLKAAADRLDAARLREMYETLERRAQHLTDLIENLLDEAVAEAGGTRLTIGPIEWCDSLRRWADVAEVQSGRPITLALPPMMVTGAGDAVKLERVVSNLLSNAAKFSEAGTPIVLTLAVDGDWVRIEVADQGIGIPADQIDRVFDRFHQVDAGLTRVAGGFGIGLSLARSFVEAHGGSIQVRSVEGEGSTFVVRLPRSGIADPRVLTRDLGPMGPRSRVKTGRGSPPAR